MDETDLELYRALSRNARTPYSELAEKLGISTPAVHRRIQALLESRILTGFSARLSDDFLKAVPVYISGGTCCRSIKEIVKDLSKNDETEFIGFSGRSFIYMIGTLRDLSELEGYLEFVRKVTQIKEMGVGVGNSSIGSMGPAIQAGETHLTSLDCDIIRSLQNDARKPVADIAKELNKSAKTIRAHLEKMIRQRVIEFTVRWNPTIAMGCYSFITFRLKSEATKSKVKAELTARLGQRMLMIGGASNIPDYLLCVAWFTTAQALSAFVSSLEDLEGVESISSDIIQTTYGFKTWKHEALEKCTKTE